MSLDVIFAVFSYQIHPFPAYTENLPPAASLAYFGMKKK